MALYLSAPMISRAMHALASSRAKRTTLFDFLNVKRTLAIKKEPSVAIAESEDAFVQALEEIGGTGLDDEKRKYLNPFALNEAGNNGYRPSRYSSNGTNSTIAGTPWLKVISLTSEKPRKASLHPDYLKELPKLILVADKKKPLPRLQDLAVWFWRGRDIEHVVAGATSDSERIKKLSDEFKAKVDLTSDEVDAIFDESADLGPDVFADTFVTSPPAPSDYLPNKELPSGETKEENLSEVSFSLVAALAAKNFVILTGPSGTGKSRAALKLAEGLHRFYEAQVTHPIFELVAVGPDWTSPKRLIGYRTPFGKERKSADGAISHDSYEITEVVKLILRASHPDSAEVPHFLIFDEMNLSHVERYFAPFLSLMEAAGILDAESGVSLIGDDDLKLISSLLDADSPGSLEAASATAMLAEGRSFILPPNLFFVGTVNVDETTYMFSPKVLDRAHVIELNAERPSDYLAGASRQEPGGTIAIGQADAALRRGIDAREQQKYAMANPATILDILGGEGFEASDIDLIRKGTIAALDGTYDILAPVGFSFGYRVSKEVFIYVAEYILTKLSSGADSKTVMSSWIAALDNALLQKVLPKIHGNKRALGDSLKALAAFYAGNDSSSTPPASYTLGLGTKVEIAPERRLKFIGLGNEADTLGRSRLKLGVMHDRLQGTGYISFVG